MAGISDQVKWRGMVKIYPAIADLDAIEDVIEFKLHQNAVGNEATLESSDPDFGKLWIITSITAFNNGGTTEIIRLAKLINANYYIIQQGVDVPLRRAVVFHSWLVLDSGEKLQAYFSGCQGATNSCRFYFTGYQIAKY